MKLKVLYISISPDICGCFRVNRNDEVELTGSFMSQVVQDGIYITYATLSQLASIAQPNLKLINSFT